MLSIVDDTYVAGMWRKHLGSALLWRIDDQEKIDGSPSSRPTTYRAPTWSWASVDGVVTTGTVREHHLTIQVDDVILTYATDDITGLVTGGWIDLCGSLKPMRLIRRELYGKSKIWSIEVNNTIVRPQDESLEEYERLGPFLHFDVPPSGDDAFESDNAAQRLFFLACRVPSDDDTYIPVLLLRLADPDKTLFERIGLAISLSHDGQEMLLADIDEEVKIGLPCLRFENGLHTIRIV
jgi:hypothetical protein